MQQALLASGSGRAMAHLHSPTPARIAAPGARSAPPSRAPRGAAPRVARSGRWAALVAPAGRQGTSDGTELLEDAYTLVSDDESVLLEEIERMQAENAALKASIEAVARVRAHPHYCGCR